MRSTISAQVKYNSFEYFENALITENGFREYDVRWLIGKEVNPNGYFILGQAYGTYMRDVLKEDATVVGHDFRAYSQEFCRSLILGVLSTGVRVIDIGMSLSPMMYFAQYHFNCRAGLQVTASHNENGWTGIKIADGLSSTLEPDGIQTFKSIVYGGKFAAGAGTYEQFDGLFEAYAEDAVRGNTLKQPVKVVVAAGNGTAGRYAPDVLRRLGCEVVELDCTADWDFKRHNPNPEDLSFLHDISEATVQNGAALGIGIDGDGDRLGVVDDKGREVFSDKLGLLLARRIAKEQPNRTIVIDVKSTGLYSDDDVLRETGTKVVIWKTGHSYIKSKVAETSALAGFEKSGHWFLNKPYGRGYDDAIVSSTHLLKMLEEADKPLSELVDGLPRTWQSPTLSPYCADDAKYDVVDRITDQYTADRDAGVEIGGKKIEDLITVNGVRFVLADKSWGLVRASSNKPCLVVAGESRTSEDLLYDIMEHIEARLDETGQVGEYDQRMPPRSSR